MAVVAAFEARFPGRLRACYVEGSYADGSFGPSSDLDLVVVFAGSFIAPSERVAAHALATTCATLATIELDIGVEDERGLERGAKPALKLAAVNIYGDDIRNNLPLIAIEDWTRDRMHSSWWRIARLFARPAVIALPLDYPEPDAPFLGYTRRLVRQADGREAPSTRDLIRLVGWAATALLALDHGIYAPTKRAAPGLFRQHAGQPWADFVSDVDDRCRVRWSYLIPREPDAQARLRALCERTLLFERYFLARYCPYLIAELQAGWIRAREACDVMRRAPLAQPTVINELREIARLADVETRAVASAALAAYDVV